jgi:hypothetical protein
MIPCISSRLSESVSQRAAGVINGIFHTAINTVKFNCRTQIRVRARINALGHAITICVIPRAKGVNKTGAGETWEKNVTTKVAEQIKQRCLFGYKPV